jgi:phosphonate transport system substrate-binding protein
MNARHTTRFTLLMLFSLGFWGCSRSSQTDYAPTYSAQGQADRNTPEYSFGIFPKHSAVELSAQYQPLMDAINRQVSGFTVRLEAAPDHPTYEVKLQQRKFDLASTNPYQALAAEKMGYRIFAKMGDDNSFRGVIFVRKDSGIKAVKDLRGKTIVFSSPSSPLSMMCKLTLRKAGLNVETDAKPAYVGEMDSVVMNTYSGMAAAGCARPPTLQEMKRERPEVIDALEVKWSSPPLVNGAFVFRTELPEAHVNAIAKAMFDLGKTQQGRLLLASLFCPHFEPADSRSYDPMRKFLQEYKRLFGKLPEIEGARQ